MSSQTYHNSAEVGLRSLSLVGQVLVFPDKKKTKKTGWEAEDLMEVRLMSSVSGDSVPCEIYALTITISKIGSV